MVDGARRGSSPVLVLASASPRRLELLSSARFAVVVRPVDVDESCQPGEDAVRLVRRLALAKAMAAVEAMRAGSRLSPSVTVLAADTTVELDGWVLGKPADAAEARDMLSRLSGRSHRVHTGVAVGRRHRWLVDHCTTTVSFRSLTPEVIARYVDGGEPADKAGAYAVQGGGRSFVAALRGSLSNVIGLPLELVVPALEEFGVQPRRD